ncbi:MAG TPA: type II toxin-antitoxin system VapB family antitoxin [Candidatus Binatia bacterium]|nr:type II toxin-antitoxin system VapB family antitoxin [Candidatus Binatia bacterium]
MKTAKIFRSGNSQTVRIPKQFQMEGAAAAISKRGASLVLRPKRTSWATLFESLEKFSDDLMERGRKQQKLQKRGRAFP